MLGAGGKTYDVILTYPPFGKKQSYRIVRDFRGHARWPSHGVAKHGAAPIDGRPRILRSRERH